MKTIIWDVDDVLNNLTNDWFEKEFLNNHSDCKITYSDLKANPPHEILGISSEEYLSSLDKFRIKYGSDLKPIPEVLEWFKENGIKYRHIALSLTPLFYAPFSSQWVFQHFGKWIRSYNFIPSKRPNFDVFIYDKDKANYINIFKNADLFIDDNLKNTEIAKENGIKSIQLPRPWNNNNSKIKEFLGQINDII